MIYNLAAAVNEQKSREEEIKKQASFWIWQLRNKKISRLDIEKKLASMSDKERDEMRSWLNHYRDLK